MHSFVMLMLLFRLSNSSDKQAIELDDLETKELWDHLLNMFELPYEDRTFGRGENKYVYILDSETPSLDPDVQEVIIPTILSIKSKIDSKILLEPRGEPPSFFDPGVEEKIVLLANFFKEAKNGNELLKYAVNIKDHINEDIFVQALDRVLHSSQKFKKPLDNDFLKSKKELDHAFGLSRRKPKTKAKKMAQFVVPPRFESYPKHFVKASSLTPSFRRVGQGIDDRECEKESDLRQGCTCERWPGWQKREQGEESKVSYWREDRDINEFHWRWHEFNNYEPEEIPCDDKRYRHGELFGYFHQQMLARYDMERLSNGLSRVKPLNEWIQDSQYRIPESFYGGLLDVKDRCYNQTIPEAMQDLVTHVQEVAIAIEEKRLTREVKTPIDMRGNHGYRMLASILERDKRCTELPFSKPKYGRIHNEGHNILSKIGCESKKSRGFGAMKHLEVSLRDPLFWRWHKFIDNMLERYKNQVPPYKPHELLNDGVEVTDVTVQSISGSIDELHTFRSYAQTNYTYHRQTLCIYQPQLNHDPFDYHISIKNYAESRPVNIRIYLAPVLDENRKEFSFAKQRVMWALMDRFTIELKKGKNVIKRGSCDSTITTLPPLTAKEIHDKIEEMFEDTSQPEEDIFVETSKPGAVCRPKCIHGECTGPNYCKCTQGWAGNICQTPLCYPSCLNGKCTGPNYCKCNQGWTGNLCQTNRPVCRPKCLHGECTGPNYCKCNQGWAGNLCQTPVCYPSCRNGKCLGHNYCECNQGWTGNRCQTQSVTVKCIDNVDYCAYLKDKCKIREWVKENCQETCGSCSKESVTVKCNDNEFYCASLKDKCKSNEWVKENCQETCGSCIKDNPWGRQAVIAFDDNVNDELQESDELKENGTNEAIDEDKENDFTYYNLLRELAMKSGGRVRRQSTSHSTEWTIATNSRKLIAVEKDCKDETSNCAEMAKLRQDMCRNPFKASLCRKTCNFCSTDCSDIISKCQKYKDAGFCETNVHVQQVCPKTCFDCKGVTGKVPCQCGLPQNLLIPKGTEEGMAFYMFVYVTPFTSKEKLADDCNDVDCSDLCARHNTKCLGHNDDEAMAFPFDRPLNQVGKTKINKIADLDKALPNAKVKRIHIYYKDQVKNERKCT